jgi:membrane protein YqaA with SNARE-associated domain
VILFTPTVVLAIALAAVSLGSLAGYAAGRAVERDMRARRRRVSTPE